MGSYKDLKVYEKSYAAALGIYGLTAKMPMEERYGLTGQMRRAATGIPLTIAEGYGKREGIKELQRYLRMALGSCTEMKVLLNFAKDLGYITPGEYEEQRAAYEEIGKMVNGLLKSLTQN